MIDGHDHARSCSTCCPPPPKGRGKPLCVIANTVKGKGVSFMHDNVAWHHGVPNKEQYEQAMRGAGLMSAAAPATEPACSIAATASPPRSSRWPRADPRIVTVVSDSVGSSKLGGFQQDAGPSAWSMSASPSRPWSAVGAGLANGGKMPFVSAASCFLTGRALEQIKADIAYSNVNVKLIGSRSGVAYGELGPTHHSIEDMAWLRLLDNLTIIVPADPWETDAGHPRRGAPSMGRSSCASAACRCRRWSAPNAVLRDRQGRDAGRGRRRRDHRQWHHGAPRRRGGRELLATEGIAARVVNMATIAPLDEAAILAAAETGAIVTVEEHNVRGGLGGAVAEVVADQHAGADAHHGLPRLPADRLGRVADGAFRPHRRRHRRRRCARRMARKRNERRA